MSETELRELDVWIDTNLFDGGKYVGLKKRGLWYRPNGQGYTDDPSEAGRYAREEAKSLEYPHDEPVKMFELPVRKFTTDPAAAMMVLKKCAAKLDGFEVVVGLHRYHAQEPPKFMVCSTNHRGFQSVSETLPLAICLFAKKLFT